jgi:hypothetical protein
MNTYAVYIGGAEHVLADEPEHLATLRRVRSHEARSLECQTTPHP